MESPSFWVSGFGFRVSGFGFRVSGFGFRVSGFGYSNFFGVWGLDDLELMFRVGGFENRGLAWVIAV